jgi:HSP20 family molecular chaperone IbpA
VRYRRIEYRYVEDAGRRQSLTDTWSGVPGMTVGDRAWRPPADVFETPDGFKVRLEVAGVDEESVEVCLYADALVVRGTRPCVADAHSWFLLVEIRHGDFLFDMPLPHGIDVERVEARYERGYLEVVLPHAGGDA